MKAQVKVLAPKVEDDPIIYLETIIFFVMVRLPVVN